MSEQLGEQLAFDFRRYDIFTDTIRPTTQREFTILQEVYRAYARVCLAAAETEGEYLRTELDIINSDLMRKIRDTA